MPSFQTDIKPLFRQVDLDHMLNLSFDMSSYDVVKTNATGPNGILDRVTRGLSDPLRMPPPPDAPWTQEMIDTFQAWIDAGFPEFDPISQSGFIVTNQDTFSTDAVTALGGVPAVFSNVFYLILDGFAAKDLGATTANPRPVVPPTLPTFTFAGAGAGNMKEVNPSASYEDPSN